MRCAALLLLTPPLDYRCRDVLEPAQEAGSLEGPVGVFEQMLLQKPFILNSKTEVRAGYRSFAFLGQCNTH